MSSANVLILVGTHCQHCAPVLSSLAEMVKEGVIAQLEVVNVEKRPEIAAELSVQSVPWLRIGWFELEGVRTKPELTRWAELAESAEGVSQYYKEILAQGKVRQCLGFLKERPETIASIFELMSDTDEKINVKLGIGVVMEEYAPKDAFKAHIPRLIEFLAHDDPRLRLDACHYLSLTNNPDIIRYIKPLLKDSDDDVREEAGECLEAIEAAK